MAASNTLRDVPIPKDASPGVQYAFRLLAQNAALTNKEITDLTAAIGDGASTLAPTNSPTATSKTIVTNEDASMDVILTWSYTQGDIPAEFFILFWKEGAAPLSALTTADNAVMVAVTARAFRYEGLNPNNNYRFGIAAGRQAPVSTGVVVGTIIQPTSGGGSWADLTFGIPNYVGTIVGVEQHNWELIAAGGGASSGLLGNTGLYRDGSLVTWSAVDSAYNGGTGFSYGLAYNLLLYDLTARATVYAHCYDTFNFGAAAADADLFESVTTGSGTANWGQPGKFGKCLTQQGLDSSNRAFFRTRAASANYQGLKYVDLWFKRNGNPAGPGDIVALGTTNAAEAAQFPILRLNPTGTVTAFAWNGTAFNSVTSVATVTDNTFHFLQARINSFTGRLEVWVDGAMSEDPASTATAFDTGNASNLFVLIGTGGFDMEGATCSYDELILSNTDHWRTIPTRELDDRWDSDGSPASGTIAIWHFEEVYNAFYFCNARKAPRALANVLNAYNVLASAGGASYRYLIALHASNEPQTNRLIDGLPEAVAAIGGSRALFSSAQFRLQSAYLVVGQCLLGEGNGIELYAGKTDGATDAVCQSSFQTQGIKILALSGTGWQAWATPGPPTNTPVPASLTNTAVNETGQRLHKLTWTYTQPGLLGDNKLADGFILYYQATNTANPTEQQVNLAATVTAYTFQWSHTPGGKVSYAIAAYRRTTSGVEIGPKQTLGAWQNVSADLYVQSFAPGPPTNNPSGLAMTNFTINTGNRYHQLTWAYTQGALPADGFQLFWDPSNTASPAQLQMQLGPDVRAYTFEWSLSPGAVVSYGIKAFRRTSNGVEMGPLITVGGWQNVAADWTVRSSGIEDGNVPTSKIPDGNITTPKINNDDVTTAKRQLVSIQSVSMATTLQNSGSSPVVMRITTTIFTHSIGKIQTVVCATHPSYPSGLSGNTTTQFEVGQVNLSASGGSSSSSVSAYYW
jgi:hypothetical protein